MNKEFRNGYAPVNGLNIYYEIHSVADERKTPLVLLHGGGDTIQTSFRYVLPALARDRRIIAFEQQGCGRTADIAERPFSFEQSADDTIALLEHLHIDRADLLGFSNGGTITLHVAMRRPQLVHRLIVITALMKRSWADSQFWESMKTAPPEVMPRQLRDAYLEVAPTLVVGSDRDVMRPEGAVELFRLLPNAQLAILPRTEHMEITTRTSWLVPMINEFLDAEMPKTM
jgi:pimeloyl-ACP methyl ester carboxylesterase